MNPHSRYVFHRKPYCGWLKVKPQAVAPKPNGMWYSVGDAWGKHCAKAGLKWNYHFISELDIDSSRLLVISTACAFDEFVKRYGILEHGRCHRLAWPRVAERFAGIEIAPYMHERSRCAAATWYLGWDCACGCIWDSSAMLSRRVVRKLLPA